MAQKPEQADGEKTAVNITAASDQPQQNKADVENSQTSKAKDDKKTVDQKTAANATVVPSKPQQNKEDVKNAQTSTEKDNKKAAKAQLYEVLFPVKINGKRNEIGAKISLDLADDAVVDELVSTNVIKKA